MTIYNLHQIKLVLLGCSLLGSSAVVLAQPSFSSGSTGSDGALDFSSLPSGTTVLFDPTTYTPPLDPAHDNIFNFTTINVPSGITVRLSARKLSGPIYWLATSTVTINGTLDLTGEQGAAGTNTAANRTIAYGGAGGYAGGIGGLVATGLTLPATAGEGPQGGTAGTSSTNAPTAYGGGGGFNGNNFLVPLFGGSGGGGGAYPSANTFGGGGGAGGGAILIASSTSIACSGVIKTSGGGGSTYAGGGAAGGIHMIAPTVAGSCGLYTGGGSGYAGGTTNGANGRVRIETSNYTGSYGFYGGPFTITATPNLYLPTVPPGTIKAISVNGVNLPATTTGSYSTPDATINTSSPVAVVIQAAQIPVGTVVTLQINSDEGLDMTITCPGLTGSMASSTTSANVTFPAGFSRGYITATW